MPYRNDEPRSASAPRAGRPRDDELERRILAAVGALLSESGYEAVSFEQVARRSGASKASLYRRWRSRRDMVLAALRAGPAPRHRAGPVDTGSLRGDLVALCRRLDETMRSADSRTAMLLLQAGLEDPDLCEAIETSVGPTGARLPRRVVDAAVARGELPPDVDPFPYEEVVGAVLLIRRLSGLPADAAYLEALVDTVIMPALRATADGRRPLPAGIFSGHPAPQSSPTHTKEIP